MRLGVIFGGISTEHDVSVVSGTSVIKNLDKSKYEIVPIFISKEGQWYQYEKPIEQIEVLPIKQAPTPIRKIENVIEVIKSLEIVFPVLHGLGGEDGSIQGMLEMLGIPYVGCGILASSVGMDKAYTKVILEKAGMEQANYVYIQKQKIDYYWVGKNFEFCKKSLQEILDKTQEELSYPMFIKPSNSGSSVGVTKAENKEELEKAIQIAAKYDTKVLIEQGIDAREIECAVLGNKEEVKASCVGEVKSAEEFYSFDAKYTNTESRTEIPANLPKELTDEVRQLAIKAFRAIDGKGLARVDFFIEKNTNRILLNEINTMPGFTTISMYPKLWEQEGKSYSELLEELIQTAKVNK